MRSITGHNSIPEIVSYNGTIAKCDADKASLFNNYFHSVFTTSDFILPPVRDIPKPQSTIGQISVTETEGYQTLISLDPSKAKGCDGISPRLLKLCALPLTQPLHHLFCLSLSQCYVPLDWRTHMIKPIFKAGDKHNVTNYRPISLLCVISKVLERIVFNKLVYQSVSIYQFGFLQHRSTLQQLLVLFNELTNSLNKNQQTDVIYLDFKKAFDSVAHNELLYKLWCFGVIDDLWMWCHAYLANRLQYVAINGAVSKILPVISGVPQGSILGPLFFLIFINDIPTAIKSSMILLFANDAKCYKSISTLADCAALQNDANSFIEWSTKWNLLLNEEKCSVLRFTTNSFTIYKNYTIKSKPITSKNFEKDLGIIVSADLKWNQHYQFILSKAYKMLGLVRQTFSSANCVSAKRLIYISLVRSQLLYCSPVWHPFLLSDIRCIENVQKRATRFIINDSTLGYKERLMNLNLLPLMMYFEIADIIFMVKCIKAPTPYFNISDYVTFCSANTRSSVHLKLKHTKTKTNLLGQFYFNRIPRLWNSLPQIDTSMSIPTLRCKLHTFFWNHFIENFNPTNVCSYHFVCPCQKCCRLPIRNCFNTTLL